MMEWTRSGAVISTLSFLQPRETGMSPGLRPCQATYCLVRLHPDAAGAYPTIHSWNLYQVSAATEGNEYSRAQQTSLYPWVVQQEEIPLSRQVPRGWKGHASSQAPRLEESTMSSSQVSIKETWVATGSPSSALAQVTPAPCPALQPQTADPEGTGSEKPWQLVVSSRPGSRLGPSRPQTHQQPLTPQASDTSRPYTPTTTKTSPEPRPIQTEKRKKAQLFVFHFAKTLYVCLYNPD